MEASATGVLALRRLLRMGTVEVASQTLAEMPSPVAGQVFKHMLGADDAEAERAEGLLSVIPDARKARLLKHIWSTPTGLGAACAEAETPAEPRGASKTAAKKKQCSPQAPPSEADQKAAAAAAELAALQRESTFKPLGIEAARVLTPDFGPRVAYTTIGTKLFFSYPRARSVKMLPPAEFMNTHKDIMDAVAQHAAALVGGGVTPAEAKKAIQKAYKSAHERHKSTGPSPSTFPMYYDKNRGKKYVAPTPQELEAPYDAIIAATFPTAAGAAAAAAAQPAAQPAAPPAAPALLPPAPPAEVAEVTVAVGDKVVLTAHKLDVVGATLRPSPYAGRIDLTDSDTAHLFSPVARAEVVGISAGVGTFLGPNPAGFVVVRITATLAAISAFPLLCQVSVGSNSMADQLPLFSVGGTLSWPANLLADAAQHGLAEPEPGPLPAAAAAAASAEEAQQEPENAQPNTAAAPLPAKRSVRLDGKVKAAAAGAAGREAKEEAKRKREAQKQAKAAQVAEERLREVERLQALPAQAAVPRSGHNRKKPKHMLALQPGMGGLTRPTQDTAAKLQ